MKVRVGLRYNAPVVIGATELTDQAVQAAAEGSEPERSHLAEVLEPRVRLMVVARLSPAPRQLHAVDEITQEALTALAAGLSRLKKRSLRGLKAYVSGIVGHKVADFLRGCPQGNGPQPVVGSLDSTVIALSRAGPLWQFLSASGTSPSGAVARAEQAERLMSELGRLKDQYRKVITLAFFDQLPTDEVAGQMNISQRAACMLLLRAVRTLRRNMTGSSRTGSGNGGLA
jgi:RNA polymerase sigma factor (sigma-70 family)